MSAGSDGESGGGGAATAADAPGGASGDATAEVAAIARAGEPDRYLAALLAPASQGRSLLALAAFAAELHHVSARVVREPMMGEIRLEWWRNALLASPPDNDSAGHSVADAMRAAIRRHNLPPALIDDMIDARALELSASPFADDAAVRDFLWRTEGTLFALAGRVLRLEADQPAEAAFRAAGEAYGLTRLIMGLPRSLSLGRVPLAATRLTAAGLSAHELLAGVGGAQAEALMRSHFAQIRGSLAEARQRALQLPRDTRLALLPLALVEPYVRRLERRLKHAGGAVLLREETQIVPLTRVWRIASAHLLGRL